MNTAGGTDNSAARTQRQLAQRFQILLDKSSPHITARWCALALSVLLYVLRVWYLRGRALGLAGDGLNCKSSAVRLSVR